MKIGISSWTYAWNIKESAECEHSMDAFDLLNKANELQVDVLQVADNLPLQSLSEEQLCRFKDQAEKLGIELQCGTQGVRPDRLLPFIELSAKLGSKLVRTLLHDSQGCPTIDEAEQYIREALPLLHNYGISLAIENHDFFSVHALKQLIDRINHPLVGICLDPVNNFAKGEGTAEVLQTLGEYTVNFHCKDYTIKRKSGGLGFDVEGCIAGDGLLDLERCATFMDNRSMSYILELWTPWQENMQKTRELENKWADSSVENLKRFKKLMK